MPTGIRPPAPGAPYQLSTIADFTGGLNRSEELVNLAENEVADITNLDPDPEGGLRLRKGVEQATQSFTGGSTSLMYARTTQNMGYYGSSQGGECILLNRSTTLAKNVDTILWFPNKTSNETRTIAVSAAVGYRLSTKSFFIEEPPSGAYVAGTTPTCYRIDDGDIYAGALTSMVELYEASYETPVTSGHPPARYACIQHNRAWIVDETNVNRVRFSHPGTALYWHASDWIDVGADSSDIVGIYPVGDVVLILKQDGLWFIQGDLLSNMRLQEIQQPFRIAYDNPYDRRSSVQAYGAVWAWSEIDGLVSINSNLELNRHSQQLRQNGRLPRVLSVSYADGKIFCQTLTETWVFHVALNAWTKYAIRVTEALEVTVDGPTTEALYVDSAVLNGAQRPVMVFDPTRTSDQLYTGSATTFIPASVRTGWQVGGAPTERKKWGRPRVLVESIDGTDIDFYIDVFKNYEYTNDAGYVARSTHTLDASVDGDTLLLRGPSGGRGEAVSYRISSVDNTKHADWALHAISPRWRGERIRR